MYKKPLNAFFLKVHPDFFHHNRQQQQANENAVAQLNELLNWAKEFKGGTLRPPPATSIAFTFYRKLDPQEGLPQGIPASSTSTMDGEAAVPVHSTFELPDQFQPSEAHRGLVERSVNKFLRDLLRRSECIDAVAESISAAEDATSARMEAKPLRRRTAPHHKGRRDPEKGKSLLEEAADVMTLQWTLTPTPTMEELMDADQLLFSRELSPLQSSTAVYTLQNHLGELHYEVWESMPLLISDGFEIGTLTGTLTIPWDFTPPQFVSFLLHNREAIDRCRAAALSFATSVEVLISELCTACDLDDVLISCAHKEAIHVLRLLHQNRDMLRAYGMTDVTLEIASRHATRANGVVLIDATTTTLDGLREWLELLQPKMALQKRLYRVSKHMLETTMWHLKSFREVAEPGGIDAFESNEFTYAQRLEWSKELYRIGASLARWDWSEFSFVLSPELDLDWEHHQLSLPYNFDGDALIRYIEEVQQEAKKRSQGQLLEQSATRRADEEARRAQAHEAEMLSMYEASATQQRQSPTSSAPTDPSAGNATGKATTTQDLYRRTHPHLEEYLASSHDTVDPLTVEQPLSHGVSFNSEAEADNQLRWEGFYEQPIVDQVPAGDIDDVAHTYMMTNRWHREAAAKKLLEELQSTYGKKSRRFDYQKMGDVMEINNAKVQPKGFPVLARGVRPGGS